MHYFRLKDVYIKNKIKLLSNKIRDEIQEIRNKAWVVFLKNIGPNPQSTKPFLQKINKFRSNNNCSIPTLIYENREYITDRDKSNLFSNIMYNTFNITGNESYNSLNFETFIKSIEVQKYNNDQRKTPLFTFKELNNEINKLNTKSSLDQLDISNMILHKLPQEMVKLILTLYSLCLTSHNLPKE
jgi:hypothetical protein